MDFHAIMEVPKGIKHAKLGHLPEIESFARSEKEHKLLQTWRVFRFVGSPYVLPPATPKDRVDVLQNAYRKALNDPEFHKEFLKLVGDEVEPVLPEELTKIIRETPRDAEVIDLLKILSAPARCRHGKRGSWVSSRSRPRCFQSSAKRKNIDDIQSPAFVQSVEGSNNVQKSRGWLDGNYSRGKAAITMEEGYE